jgi:hypothetical protein
MIAVWLTSCRLEEQVVAGDHHEVIDGERTSMSVNRPLA